MAEVQDTPQTAQEPSMEEILASIRKIISDEQPATAAPVAPEAVAAADVIELTQVVQDDGSVVEAKVEEPLPPPPPSPSPPEPFKVAAVESPPQPPPPTPPPPPPAPSKLAVAKAADALVSDNAVEASASTLSVLANTVEIDRIASQPRSNTMFGNGTRTLEDMVIELMRPMLKDWLDENLSATVERLVQKEIERISKRTS